MFRFLSVADVKAEAKAIHETLKNLNPQADIPLGHCYELIAKRAGYNDWREYKAFLDPEPDEVPDDTQLGRVHVRHITRDQAMVEARRLQNKRDILLSRPVTKQSYADAVAQLLNTTQMSGTSGARVCARLLLSLYNATEWHFDMSELNLLDYENYVPAIMAIRGRTELMIEPHRLVSDGDQVFSELWERFERYRKTEIWKPECRSCEGRGRLWDDERDDWGDKCSVCKGKGYRDPADNFITALREIRDLDTDNIQDPAGMAKHIAKSALWGESIYD